MTHQTKLWRTRPFQVDPWLDLPPPYNDSFPFEGFELLEKEVLRLASMINPIRNPGGTTVLVTGERGAGKTSLVNAAIFHASLLARFEDGWIKSDKGLLDEMSWKAWGETEWLATSALPDISRIPYWRNEEQKAQQEQVKRAQEDRAQAKEERSKRLKGFRALILLDVHVPFPEDHLEQRHILSRTLRRLYFRLVNAGLADANPQFVRNARLAYLRSIATGMKSLESKKEKYVANFTSGLEKGEIGLAASRELELAWELAIELERSSEAEMGDDLQLLLEDLARLRLGGEGILKRAMRALTGMFDGAKEFFLGDEQLRIHPIIVFDELDKAQPKVPPSQRSDEEKTTGRLDKARDLAWVVGTLKTVLTAHGASFVFIAGPEQAQRWSSSGEDADLLRSVFSDRFHVRCLDCSKVEAMVRSYVTGIGNAVAIEELAQALHYVSGGQMRSAIRLLREAQLKLKNDDGSRTRSFAADHLIEVLAGHSGADGSRTEHLSNEVRALALNHRVVVYARDRLVIAVRELEIPSAATRVAGKIYALEDAMWGAAQRTLEILRILASRNAVTMRGLSDGETSAATPSIIDQAVNALVADSVVTEAARWLTRLSVTHHPGMKFVQEPFLLMIEKVLDAVDALGATLLESEVLRLELARGRERTGELGA